MAAKPLPSKLSIVELREAARRCKACPLWKRATQTVFGEGPATAEIMLVGEQPGDQEDRSGHPFVGPRASFWNARSNKPESIDPTSM
jgi:DNA polymerase